MSRDNTDRLGVLPQEETPTPQNTNGVSLNYVVPTEIVELPSGGKLYPSGHKLRDKKELEIKHMTAKEEDILTSRSLLKKGIAIDKMLESLLLDKTLKLEELILGDKNALILAARKTGYGSKYDTEITCPKCEQKSKFSFDLDQISNKEITIPESIQTTDNGTFIITLPKTQAQLELKPMTGKEEKALLELQEQRKKENKLENILSSQMKMFVVAVNGSADKQAISKFVESMPAMDGKFLRQTYKTITPDVDMRQNFVCNKCDHEEVLEVPLTTEFFWPQ